MIIINSLHEVMYLIAISNVNIYRNKELNFGMKKHFVRMCMLSRERILCHNKCDEEARMRNSLSGHTHLKLFAVREEKRREQRKKERKNKRVKRQK